MIIIPDNGKALNNDMSCVSVTSKFRMLMTYNLSGILLIWTAPRNGTDFIFN